MPDLILTIIIFAFILSVLILFCIKTGFSFIAKICGVLVLLVVIVIQFDLFNVHPDQIPDDPAFRDTSSQENAIAAADDETGPTPFTENKERNRKEGILYEIDDAEKVTLTSRNGEICVKLPRWKGFSAVRTDFQVGNERCKMTNEAYDSMTYELIASWDQEDADAEIAAYFKTHYNRDNVQGDVYHMTVNGIKVSYRPCYEFIYSQCIDWHYVIWADLGCGQFLKTEITEGLQSDEAVSRAYDYEIVPREVTEPLNIEGMIEALYTNIEVCTPQGDSIEIAYRERLTAGKEEAWHNFSFGTLREYAKDEYKNAAACAELIDHLSKAMQTGDIEKLLQQEALVQKELSIAEKMDYIKKETTGTLIRHDALHAYIRDNYRPPSKYYLAEVADPTKAYFVYKENDSWEHLYNYVWFPCETDRSGEVRAQSGRYIYCTDTSEIYFLSDQGNPYLCVVNRDNEANIESVVLHDFVTPDLIGTLVYIDASSVLVSSYVRNERPYGTERPWYLYYQEVDTGPVFLSLPDAWKVTAFLGESAALRIEDTGSSAYAEKRARTRGLTELYLGHEIVMRWDRNGYGLTSFQSASPYGYYYTSPENLYKVYGQPEALAMKAPVAAATIKATGYREEMDLLMDKNGRAAICVEGRFFLLEKADRNTEELRTWK